MLRSLISILVSLMVTSICAAQSRQVPAPPQDALIVIQGATIHTMVGEPITDGYVTINDGRITGVGSGSAPNGRGMLLIDGEGLHVYPGLVSVGTMLGLIETSATDVTHDHDEVGNMTPEVRAAIAVNPDSDHLPVTRETGILTAVIFPTGGRVPGRASAIRLDGWTVEDLTILDDAGLVVNWPRYVSRPSRGGPFDSTAREENTSIDELDDLIEQARAWSAAYETGEVDHDLALEAMQSVLDGSRPVFLLAQTRQQITSAVAWAKRHELSPIIVGGSAAMLCAELLVQEDVPVVCSGVMDMPKRRDLPYDDQYTLPKRLLDAGIRFCLGTGDSGAHERRLPFHAGKAVAYGLTTEQAIAAITRDAAEICGLGDELGTIEVGKAGTLILTTGSPLDIRSRVVRAWIDGREITLENRHSDLNAKYREKYRQLGR